VAAWIIRPYEPGDESALVALYERVFGRPMSVAHWRWKLGHAGRVPNVFVAVVRDGTGDRIVSQCAAIPLRYLGPTGELHAMVAVDAMTDPDFRRQGLLTAVHRQGYGVWRDAGFAFVAGLPNQQWGSRARALGWRELFPLAWRLHPLRLDRIVARRYGLLAQTVARMANAPWNIYWARRRRTNSEIHIRRVTTAHCFDDFWRRLETSRGQRSICTLVRDREWIDWRYLSAPDSTYVVLIAEADDAVVGYAVCRLRVDGDRRVGYVPELAALKDDATVLQALLRSAITELAANGAELVASLTRPGTPLDRVLRGAGFLFSWGAFSVQAVPLQMADTPVLVDVHGGDFDVV